MRSSINKAKPSYDKAKRMSSVSISTHVPGIDCTNWRVYKVAALKVGPLLLTTLQRSRWETTKTKMTKMETTMDVQGGQKV